MLVKLKDVCTFESNNFNKKDNWTFVNYLDTSNLTENIIQDFQYLEDLDNLPSRAKRKVKIGDILFSSVRPNQKHYGFIDKEYPNLLVSTGFIVLTPTEKVNNKFLYYWLIQDKTIDILQTKAETNTSAYPSITKEDMYDLEINLPPLEIQDKIANILSNIDNQIERNNAMTKRLQVLAQTTYSRWFNQFEFPNNEEKPYKSNGGELVYNKELSKEIPASFSVKSLGDIIVESKKSTVQVGEARLHNGNYPFFTSGAEILPYKDYFVDGPYCFLNTGGNADVKFYEGKSAYSTDTWCLSANEYSYWLYLYLENIKSNMDQLFFSGSGLKHLQKDVFKKQVVCLPNKELIEQFNLIVSKLFKYQSKIIQENKELVALKEKLLPLLINGQLNI